MSCELLFDDASGLKKYRLLSSSGHSAEVCCRAKVPKRCLPCGLKRAAQTGAARAQVFEHGAHVTSWRNAAGEELLFLSKKVRTSVDGRVASVTQHTRVVGHARRCSSRQKPFAAAFRCAGRSSVILARSGSTALHATWCVGAFTAHASGLFHNVACCTLSPGVAPAIQRQRVAARRVRGAGLAGQ
jgi:hypothetical protein